MHQSRIEGDPGFSESVAISGKPLEAGISVLGVSDEGDPPVAMGDKVFHAAPRPIPIRGKYSVRRFQSNWRPVNEDHMESGIDFRPQVGLVVWAREKEQTIDAPSAERQGHFPGTLFVTWKRCGEQKHSLSRGDAFHGPGHHGLKGVGNILNDKADSAGMTSPESGSPHVGTKPGFADGLLNPCPEIVTHVFFVVHDPRHGLQADAGASSNVLHRGPGSWGCPRPGVFFSDGGGHG